MYPIKLKKKSSNVLDFDNIEIISSQLFRKRCSMQPDINNIIREVEVYDYNYICVCDGDITLMCENDLWEISEHYEVVS